jgi:hypothetical protein
MSSETTTTISPGLEAILCEAGNLTPTDPTSRMRKIALATYLSSSAEEHVKPNVEIHHILTSEATLRFCGFDPTSAREIWILYTYSTSSDSSSKSSLCDVAID